MKDQREMQSWSLTSPREAQGDVLIRGDLPFYVYRPFLSLHSRAGVMTSSFNSGHGLNCAKL